MVIGHHACVSSGFFVLHKGNCAVTEHLVVVPYKHRECFTAAVVKKHSTYKTEVMRFPCFEHWEASDKCFVFCFKSEHFLANFWNTVKCLMYQHRTRDSFVSWIENWKRVLRLVSTRCQSCHTRKAFFSLLHWCCLISIWLCIHSFLIKLKLFFSYIIIILFIHVLLFLFFKCEFVLSNHGQNLWFADHPTGPNIWLDGPDKSK